MYTTIYSKYSNERDPRLAVRTDILEDACGNRIVRKLPEYPEGEAHVAALFHWYQVFSARLENPSYDTKACLQSGPVSPFSSKAEPLSGGLRLTYNRCRLVPGGVELEYVSGESLEDHLLTILRTRGADACAEEFLPYLQYVRSIHTGTVFTPCEAFRTVFGDVSLPTGTVCAPCTNIDLLCENVHLSESKPLDGTSRRSFSERTATVIDYEWSFDFPIPVNYLLYRIIFYFTAHASRGEEFARFDFPGKMGITKEEIATYEAMETHFQHYVTGTHVPVRDLYDDISDGYVRPTDSFIREDLQVYFDYGEGLSEENSVLCRIKFGDCWRIQTELALPDGVKALRVDPGYHAAMVHLTELRFDNQPGRTGFSLREGAIQGDWLYFTEDDPNIRISSIPRGAKHLLIELEIYRLDAVPMREIGRLAKADAERKNPLGKIKKSAKAILKPE